MESENPVTTTSTTTSTTTTTTTTTSTTTTTTTTTTEEVAELNDDATIIEDNLNEGELQGDTSSPPDELENGEDYANNDLEVDADEIDSDEIEVNIQSVKKTTTSTTTTSTTTTTTTTTTSTTTSTTSTTTVALEEEVVVTSKTETEDDIEDEIVVDIQNVVHGLNWNSICSSFSKEKLKEFNLLPVCEAFTKMTTQVPEIDPRRTERSPPTVIGAPKPGEFIG